MTQESLPYSPPVVASKLERERCKSMSVTTVLPNKVYMQISDPDGKIGHIFISLSSRSY